MAPDSTSTPYTDQNFHASPGVVPLSVFLFLFTCVLSAHALDGMPEMSGMPFGGLRDGTRGLAEIVVNGVPGGTIEFSVDGDGGPVITGQSLGHILASVVKPEILRSIIAGNRIVTDGSLEPLGILVEYDPASLRLSFTVSPRAMIPTELGLPGSGPRGGTPITPELFSASLGLALHVDPALSFGGTTVPELKASLGLDPAVRLFGLVAEGGFDVGYSESFWMDLRDARVVMDFPGIGARAALGTVAPSFTSLRTLERLVGFGFYSEAGMPGGKRSRSSPMDEVRIDRPADITVAINGTVVRKYHLPGGSYRISELPLDTGLNTVSIRIDEEGSAPKTYTVGLPFDGDLLPPGQMDYSLYLGVERDGLEDPLAFASFSVGTSPFIELGVAASAGPGSMSGEGSVLWASPVGSLRLSPAATLGFPAASLADFGYAARLEWRLSIPDRRYVPRLGAGIEYRSAGFRTSVLETSLPTSESWLVSSQLSQSIPGGAGSFSIFGTTGFSSGMLDGLSVHAGFFVLASTDVSFTVSGGIDWRPASGFEPSASISIAIVPSTRRTVFYRQDLIESAASIQIDIPLGENDEFGIGMDGRGLPSDVDNQREAGIHGRYSGELLDLFASASYSAFNRDDPGRADFSLSASSAVAFAGGYFALASRVGDAFLFIVPRQGIGDETVALQPWDGPAAASEGGKPRLVPELRPYKEFSAIVLMPGSPVDIRPDPETVRIMPGYRSGTIVGIGVASNLAFKGRLVTAQGAVRALLSGAIFRMGGGGERLGSTFSDALGYFEYYGILTGSYRVRWSDGSTSLLPEIVETSVMADFGDVIAIPAGEGEDR